MCYKRPVSKENKKGLLAEFGGPFLLCHSLNFLQGLWARKSMLLLKGSSAFLFQTINDASMPIHFPYKNLSWCKHSFPSWPLFLIFLLFIFTCLKVFQVSESLGVDDRVEAVELETYQTSQSWRKSTLNIHWKDGCWSWSSNSLATWCEEPAHWKRPWFWERLRAGGEEGHRRDGWMASQTQRTWVWANSRR